MVLVVFLIDEVLLVSVSVELYIGLTQENLMENSVQGSLPYILKPHGLC